MAIKCLSSGLLTTVQDLGRYGYQKDGVSVTGAMDIWSLRLANLLVGNFENEAGLEMTLLGPTLRFEEDALIAITGANFVSSINGRRVPMGRPVFIKGGSELIFHSSVLGSRSYLAVSGGLEVSKVMSSKSTYLLAGFGGHEGRAIRAGDSIKVGQPKASSLKLMKGLKQSLSNCAFVPARWYICPNLLNTQLSNITLHILPGPEWRFFTFDTIQTLLTANYKISPNSNRMGYRLQGPSLKLKNFNDMLSSPMTIGTIQVPPDGGPIILMADGQTTGGYPRIGHVIGTDIPLLAQAKPGDTIRFQRTTLADAHERLFKKEKELRIIKRAIEKRLDDENN